LSGTVVKNVFISISLKISREIYYIRNASGAFGRRIWGESEGTKNIKQLFTRGSEPEKKMCNHNSIAEKKYVFERLPTLENKIKTEQI
jgi:hypothetical protein